MKPYRLLIAFSLTVLLFSCRKPVEQGKIIKASGVVFDVVKNKPLPNVKLYLFGARQNFYSTHYSEGPLDSVTSDNNGRFSIQYTAEGKSIDYGISANQFHYGRSNYVADPYDYMYKFNFRLNVNDVTVKARELNYTKIHLKIGSNPYDTLLVRQSTPSDQEIYIKGRTVDTTFYLRHLPNERTVISYWAQGYVVDSFFIRRRLEDTIIATMADTLFINKTIGNTYSIPRG